MFQEQDIKVKAFPCVTACPLDAFKTRGLFFKEKDYLDQTFAKEEIFYDEKKIGIFNESIFYIEELRSLFRGRCYMVCPLKKKKLKDHIRITFKKGVDIKGDKSMGNHLFS